MFRNQTLQRTVASIVLTTFTSLTLSPAWAAAKANGTTEKAGLLTSQKGVLGSAKRYLSTLDGTLGGTIAAKASSADDHLAKLLADIHEELKVVTPQTAMSPDAQPGRGSKGPDYPSSPNAAGAEGEMQTRAVGPDIRIEVARSKEPALRPLSDTDIAARVSAIRGKAGEIRRLYPAIERSFKDTEQYLKDARLPGELLQRHAATVAQYNSRKAAFEDLMAKVEQASANAGDLQSALADLGSFMAKHPNSKPHQYTDPNKLPFGVSGGKVRAPNVSKEQYQSSLFPPRYDKVLLAGAIPDGLQFTQTALPPTPNAADLATTDDVQLTQAIRDKAAALNKNPVAIYNWVRNNIEFMPTYGSIQGSALTLLNKRGNAFDTASLLIALYRASGIPARYAYGTIDVPADKVMNWVGGVAKAEAAQALLGQGGVPNVGIAAGGKIGTIRMEHVWVQAYVDNTPSRGAINKTPNAWVPMDASFKQYSFAGKVNAADALGFDKNAYQQAFLASAVIDSNGDRMFGGGQADLGNQVEDYQHKAIAWAKSIGEAKAEEQILGKKNILQSSPSILLGTLPYKVLLQANEFQSLPNNLKWKMTVSYFSTEIDAAYDNAAFVKTIPLSTVGNRRIGLSYVPATDADKNALDLLKSRNATSLPAYLIRGIPRLSMDSDILADGSATQFGTEQIVLISLSDPNGQDISPASHKITAGDEIVFAVDAAGISQKTIDDRFSKFASNSAAENLQTAGTVFWMLHDISNDMVAAAHNVVAFRLPSVGAFSSPLLTKYMFGIPRSGSYLSRYADVKRAVVAATTTDGQVPVSFMSQIGIQSSNAEGLAFDMTFSRETGSGGSAVRHLNQALADGGAVLRITAANKAILPGLAISSDVKTDILNAVAAGKEAIVSDREVIRGAWKGSGYILIDPKSGAGAYLISGGYNGGTDDPGCGGEPSTAPAAQSVEKPNLGFFGILAIAIICILAAPIVIEFAVVIALSSIALASNTAAAAPPGGGVSSSVVSVWEKTFGRAFGPMLNGPNYPGDGVERPGDCTDSQLTSLSKEQNRFCSKKGSCDKGECNLAVIQESIANAEACIGKRLEIMFTCFRGGDARHWGEVEKRLKGISGCHDCLAKVSGECKP